MGANPIPVPVPVTIAARVECAGVLADDARSARGRLDEQLAGQLLLHGVDVADHADGAPTLTEFVERSHRELERVAVE